MHPVQTIDEVLAAIQGAKSGATAFCTNFFPSKPRLAGWIKHGELYQEPRDGVVFFFRRDRDFWHLYFSAASVTALGNALETIPMLDQERIALDLVGQEGTLGELVSLFESKGFRSYKRLVRMARTGTPCAEVENDEVGRPDFANPRDRKAILGMLEQEFDRYGDQIPMSYEIDAAIANHQILAVKQGEQLAGLLFFETQGMTSTLRFWAVGEQFRALGLGLTLLRQYFEIQKEARRFVLWVTEGNQRVMQIYERLGYRRNGLADHVLVNPKISA